MFTSRPPTTYGLENCMHFDLTSDQEWEPDRVDLTKIRRLSQVESKSRAMYMVTMDGKESLYSSLIQIKELSVSQLALQQHDNEIYSTRRTFISKKRHAQLTAESLAELWGIGPKRAKATLLTTTQNGIRSVILPLSWQYRADQMYNIKRSRGRFTTDTFFSDMRKSIHGNTCCQVFSHKVGFQACYLKPNAKGESLREALDDFVHDFGAPEHLTFDGHQSQVGKKTRFYKGI